MKHRPSFVQMICVIPYKDYGGVELKYCLRGIEKFVSGAEIILIGKKPEWVRNVEHIPFEDEKLLHFKERNIFMKILQVKRDFLFFNDDHYLLQPFDKNTYHYSGSLPARMHGYGSNQFSNTIRNTIDIIGDADNYFRHGPIWCRHTVLEALKVFDWNVPWGYCVKSLYCHYAGIKGTEYPDLKIRIALTLDQIKFTTHGREYFSTGNHCMNKDMLQFLEETYPGKSQFEK